MPRIVSLAVVTTAVVALTSACDFTGAGSLALPFRPGTSDQDMTVTVDMRDAASLVPNSEVKVADITVGTVTAIRFSHWRAELTVGLNHGTVLPADAVAKVGQKSLLGATYLELGPPPGRPGTGRLRHGDVIPVERSGAYPSTEQVLASLSVVLNGGGLNQIRTINTELNNAFDGREVDFRQLVDNLQGLVGTLDEQKTQIIRAIDGLDRLGAGFADQRPSLERALDEIPQGLEVLNRNRAQLTDTLAAVGDLGTVANRVVDSTRTDLLSNLHDLRPTLGRLADADKDLTESLSFVTTFPFPYNTSGKAFRGDYANLYATIDVTQAELRQNFLSGTPLGGLPPLLPRQSVTTPLGALLPGVPGLAPAITPQQRAQPPSPATPGPLEAGQNGNGGATPKNSPGRQGGLLDSVTGRGG